MSFICFIRFSMYEEACFCPASCSLHSIESIHGSQSRRVGDEPTVLRRVFRKKWIQPEVLQSCSSASRRDIVPRAIATDDTRLDLGCVRSSYSQCTGEHVLTYQMRRCCAAAASQHVLLALNASPGRPEQHADKGEWHAKLAPCAPPSKTTRKNNKRTECARPIAVRLYRL
jgi:hypothetical protein